MAGEKRLRLAACPNSFRQVSAKPSPLPAAIRCELQIGAMTPTERLGDRQIVTATFRSLLALSLLLLGASGFAGNAAAADFTCVSSFRAEFAAENKSRFLAHFPSGRLPQSGQCRYLLISGPIRKGDARRFSDLLQKSHPFLQHLLLDTPGGLVGEAMEIGKMVRRALVETVAPGIWPVGDQRGVHAFHRGILRGRYLSMRKCLLLDLGGGGQEARMDTWPTPALHGGRNLRQFAARGCSSVVSRTAHQGPHLS